MVHLEAMANNTVDRTAGSHSLAAAGQRERSAHEWAISDIWPSDGEGDGEA